MAKKKIIPNNMSLDNFGLKEKMPVCIGPILSTLIDKNLFLVQKNIGSKTPTVAERKVTYEEVEHYNKIKHYIGRDKISKELFDTAMEHLLRKGLFTRIKGNYFYKNYAESLVEIKKNTKHLREEYEEEYNKN